jgi:hypothetical protein
MSLRDSRTATLQDVFPASGETGGAQLADMAEASPLKNAKNLRDWKRKRLSRGQRLKIIRQGLLILEDTYVHLRMKEVVHAIDPVGRLKLLLRTVQDVNLNEQLDEDEFQREMLDIFFSLRDRHTVYTLPDYGRRSVAFLPFMVEEIGPPLERRYIISKILDGFETPTFEPGAEVVFWNGVPIEQAVWNYAQRHAGSNLDARRAMGLLNLTLRALQFDPAPDEHWVVVEYRRARGNRALLARRFDWKVGDDPWPEVTRPHTGESGAQANDPKLETAQNVRLAMYSARSRPRAAPKPKPAVKGVTFTETDTRFWRVFRVRRYATPKGKFGYVRIWRFSELGETQFRDEFVKILRKLPKDGLIIDIRGNPGGKINLAEVILQTLSPFCIQPETFQFRNTQLAWDICNSAPESEGLEEWKESISEGLRTGAVYSAAFTKSDTARCNKLPREYKGPVVLITDALTYSAGDIFAAGFQDHGIGWVLGVHETTGAGGANRWTYDKLLGLELPGQPYRELPFGAGFHVAIRRSLRVYGRNGAILEDFGVKSDKVHYMTREDVLSDNVKLILRAVSLLKGPQPEVQLPLRPRR